MEAMRLFFLLARPLFLVGAALLYALGAGIARYLGHPIDPGTYLLGQAWITAGQLAVHFLNEYYDAPVDADNRNRTPFSGGSGALGPGKLPRGTALYAGLTSLAVAASLTVMLQGVTRPGPLVWVLLGLIFLGAFFYSVPPVRLVSTGYGELTTSIIVANLVPALAFALQTGELHRLLAMTTFPLTALHIAMMLAFELPDYLFDMKHGKGTLMVRLGWENGMLLHNLLILIAYILLGLAAAYGLPLPVALPPLLTLPVGLLQIWQMRRIAGGAPPNWRSLTMTALALFGATAYLLAFAYWIR